MKMTKKVLAAVMACVMLLCIMPISIFAETVTEGVWVAGTLVSATKETYFVNDNAGGITANGATAKNYNVKFTPATEETPATLTLKDVSLTKCDVCKERLNYNTSYREAATIYSNIADLTINLVGENTIDAVEVSKAIKVNDYTNSVKYEAVSGIRQESGTLTVDGKGSLVIKLYNLTNNTASISNGIKADTLNIMGRVKLNIEGGNGISGNTINVSEKPKINIKSGSYGAAIFGGAINLAGGNIEAAGQYYLFRGTVSWSDYYVKPRVKVSTYFNANEKEKYDSDRPYELTTGKYHWVKITERSNFEGFFINTGEDILNYIGTEILGPIIIWIISQFI